MGKLYIMRSLKFLLWIGLGCEPVLKTPQEAETEEPAPASGKRTSCALM